jgi:hypothetical protein
VDREFVALVEAELSDFGVRVGRESIEAAAASLAVHKNLLLNGGKHTQRLALARALGSAAAARSACDGALEIRVRYLRDEVAETWGQGIREDALAARFWLVIDAIDQWPFARTRLVNPSGNATDPMRIIATASGRAGQPGDATWRSHRDSFAWVRVGN